MLKIIKKNKGFTGIRAILASVAVLVLVIILTTTVLPIITSDARSTLERQGYVVLAAGEYELLAKEATAYAAVVNAEAAVVAAQIAAAKIELFNSAESLVFPETTATTVTFTAGGGVDTFGAWAEIVDSGATTFSSKFAANNGYLSEMLPYTASAPNELYLIELSFGAAKTVIGRTMFYSTATTRFNILVKSELIPAGETLYYRMMNESGGATCEVILRYFYE